MRKVFAPLLFAKFLCVFSACAQADIYQWKDESGRIHYSDKRSSTDANVYQVSPTSSVPASVRLDVPLVKQGESLCGPATIEMLFRFWGIHEYDQYDIAYNLLLQFAHSKRVRQSGILQTEPIDWTRYPGSGTISMREFLKRFATVENPKLKSIPSDQYLASQESKNRFEHIKKTIASGIPVIVHQYWGKVGSRGHYRIAVGYDDNKRQVYLNDSTHGSVVTQSYERFLELWNVDEPWLHYNAIVFNANRTMNPVNLKRFDGQKPSIKRN